MVIKLTNDLFFMSHLLIIHVAALLCVWFLTTYFIADKEENYALVRRIVVNKETLRNHWVEVETILENWVGFMSGEGAIYGKLSICVCCMRMINQTTLFALQTLFQVVVIYMWLQLFSYTLQTKSNNLVRTQLNPSGGGIMSQCSSGVFAPDHNPPQCWYLYLLYCAK